MKLIVLGVDVYKRQGRNVMVFNKEITGYENEEEFAAYLNGKQVGRV